MTKLAYTLTLALFCGGCARSSTTVLDPYTLADGKMFQDVVTVAADENGTAPVVTHTKTFELRTGYKGAASAPTLPVAEAHGTSSGLVATLSGAALSAAIPAATGVAIAASGWNRMKITNTANASNAVNVANDINNSSTNAPASVPPIWRLHRNALS